MALDICPVCAMRPCPVEAASGRGYTVRCPRCGDFEIETKAALIAQEWAAGRDPGHPPKGRFAASHAIRRMQVPGQSPPRIDTTTLGVIWAQPLPTPQRQVESLILALGDQDLPMDEYVRWRVERFCAEMGTRDDPTTGRTSGFNIIRTIYDNRLIDTEPQPPSPNIGLRLTFEGWKEYDRLRREVADSKTAFMA